MAINREVMKAQTEVIKDAFQTKQQIIDDGHAAKRSGDDTDLERFLDEIREEAFAEPRELPR